MKNLFALFFLYSLTTLGQEITVKEIKGEVGLYRDGLLQSKLEIGQELQSLDRLTTGPLSMIVLDLDGKGSMRISPESDLELSNLFDESTTQEEGMSVSLKLGSMFVEIMQDLFPGEVKINHKSTSIGVRGTKLFTAVEDDDLWTAVEHGEVEVQTSQGVDLLSTSEGIVVEKGGTPTEIQNYDWVKKIDWQSSGVDQFRLQRNERRKEFREKRKQWKANPERLKRLEQIKNRWTQNRTKRREMLMSMKQKRQERKQFKKQFENRSHQQRRRRDR